MREGKLPPPVLVTEPAALERLEAELRQEPVIAVDTESDSLYAYHYKVCLIQISLPGTDYLLDPLSLPNVDLLGPIFASPAIQKVFHAAENDVLALKRDYGFAFANIFDTLWAARILGWDNLSFAAIMEERFGVRTNKRAQRTNWGRRPLTPEQLAYARLDSHYLLPLREIQIEELKAAGRLVEAVEAFARIPDVTWEEKPFDPEGFWHLSGAKELSPGELAVLRELYLWREQRASELDRPLFKVMGDRVLVKLAQEQPRDRDALEQVHGISRNQARWHGEDILSAIAEGQQAAPPKRPSRRPRGSRRRVDRAVQERFEMLRAWRNLRAAERGVDPDVLLSNDELKDIAERAPSTLEDLEDIDSLGPWRRETYGRDLVELLVGAHPH